MFEASLERTVPLIVHRSLVEVLLRVATRDPAGKGRSSLPAAWASTRGAVRADNQDRLIIGLGASGVAFAVLADGMGGMKEGARAAALATAATATLFAGNAGTELDRLVEGALRFANEEVFRVLRGAGGAATVLAAWKNGVCYVAHAGDARGYVISGAPTPQVKQLTIDDTLDAELARLGRRRDTEPELHRGLVQFIGVGPDLEPHITRVPDGSRGLLLTTDGVHSIPATVLEWIVRGATQLQSLPERLVMGSEWQGGRDNGTAIVIGFQNGSPIEPVGVADFWVGDEHVVIPATALVPGPSNLGERRLDVQVDKEAPGRPSRGNRKGGGGRRPSKPRSREAKPHTLQQEKREEPRLPLVDFAVPPKGEDPAPPPPPLPAPDTEQSPTEAAGAVPEANGTPATQSDRSPDPADKA